MTQLNYGALPGIEDLNDAAISGPIDGQVLTYNSSTQKWEAADAIGDDQYIAITSTTDNGGNLTFTRTSVGTVTYTYDLANFGGIGLDTGAIRGLYVRCVSGARGGNTISTISATYPDGTEHEICKTRAADGDDDFVVTDVVYIPVNIGQSSLDLTLTISGLTSGVTEATFEVIGASQKVGGGGTGQTVSGQIKYVPITGTTDNGGALNVNRTAGPFEYFLENFSGIGYDPDLVVMIYIEFVSKVDPGGNSDRMFYSLPGEVSANNRIGVDGDTRESDTFHAPILIPVEDSIILRMQLIDGQESRFRILGVLQNSAVTSTGVGFIDFDYIAMRGTIDNTSLTNGFIDSTTTVLASDQVWHSELGVLADWSTVFPISVASHVNKTEILMTAARANSGTNTNEEDHATMNIFIDWDEESIQGWFGKVQNEDNGWDSMYINSAADGTDKAFVRSPRSGNTGISIINVDAVNRVINKLPSPDGMNNDQGVEITLKHYSIAQPLGLADLQYINIAGTNGPTAITQTRSGTGGTDTHTYVLSDLIGGGGLDSNLIRGVYIEGQVRQTSVSTVESSIKAVFPTGVTHSLLRSTHTGGNDIEDYITQVMYIPINQGQTSVDIINEIVGAGPHDGVASFTIIGVTQVKLSGNFKGLVTENTDPVNLDADHDVVLIDTSAGDITVNFPQITSLNHGQVYTIKNIGTSGNDLIATADVTNPDSLEDLSSFITVASLIVSDGDTVEYIADVNSNTWWLI
jgi:hypothetical protein